jgi:Lon protease-like protein
LNFSGVAPVFPLPDLSLFPDTQMAYHIFEPRYIEMLESALEGEKLITIALLKPGFENDYHGNPEYYPMGVLGEIIEYETLSNGEYNIVVQGIVRVGIGELVKDFPYRVARVDLIPEDDINGMFEDEKREIILRLGYLAEFSTKGNAFTSILGNQEKFPLLVNVIARTVPVKQEQKYELLTMDTIKQRSKKVLWYLDDQIETLELLKKVDPPVGVDRMIN